MSPWRLAESSGTGDYQTSKNDYLRLSINLSLAAAMTNDTDYLFSNISVQTCEDTAAGDRRYSLAPTCHETSAQFRIQDPFGLRRAIVPVFHLEASGNLKGYGTAFAVDPWGTFVTADHVVAEYRQIREPTWDKCDDNPGRRYLWNISSLDDGGFVLLYGFGLALGCPAIPSDAIATIASALSPVIDGNNPMKALTGQLDLLPLDFSVCRTMPPIPTNYIKTLPIRSRPIGPRPGETVVAVGYSKIETVTDSVYGAAQKVEAGLFAGYGQVTRICPLGRDSANPTPVFEVVADWPAGMSGGPVFNAAGEVIGLVSRGISPENGSIVGQAWATWFEGLPDLPIWLPTVDTNLPCWRNAWAALCAKPWSLAGISADPDIAERLAMTAERRYAVVKGSWRIGSDDFVINSDYASRSSAGSFL